MLHLVQRGRDWMGPEPARPFLALPNVTDHPSTTNVPINVLLYNGPCSGFSVPIKGLTGSTFNMKLDDRGTVEEHFCLLFQVNQTILRDAPTDGRTDGTKDKPTRICRVQKQYPPTVCNRGRVINKKICSACHSKGTRSGNLAIDRSLWNIFVCN